MAHTISPDSGQLLINNPSSSANMISSAETQNKLQNSQNTSTDQLTRHQSHLYPQSLVLNQSVQQHSMQLSVSTASPNTNHSLATAHVNKQNNKRQREDNSNSMDTNSISEDTFQVPNKKHTISAAHVNSKYVVDLTAIHNKFAVLDDMDETSSNASDTTQSVPKVKIPPIFLHQVNNYQQIIKDLTSIIGDKFSTQQQGKVLKINTLNVSDFRSITKFLEDSKLPFHTYRDPTNKKLEVVLRNVPFSLTNEEVLEELKSADLPVTNVVRLLHRDKQPMPMCVVELLNNEEAKRIFELTHIQHAIISVEYRRKSPNIPQCTRCQRYGHTKNFCHLPPRCVKCKNDHHFSECNKPKHIEPTCVNCGQNHPANFKGCSYYLAYKESHKRRNSIVNSATINNTSSPSPPINDETNFPPMPRRSPTTAATQQTSTSGAQSTAWPLHTNTNAGSATSDTSSSSLTDHIINLIPVLLSFIKPYIPQIKSFIASIITTVFQNGQ